MYTHHSHVHISHQLCSIRFYCNCKKFYHYDLFHVRQNRRYEVGICWLREKGHTHTLCGTTKVHKNKRSTSMREKNRKREKVLRHNAKHHKKCHVVTSACQMRMRTPPLSLCRICMNLSQSMAKEKERREGNGWERQMSQGHEHGYEMSTRTANKPVKP
jgi:hypothetical protein